LSFDKKVAFHKRWAIVFKAMLLPCLFFIAWDIFFTQRGVWSFNPQYIIGIMIFNLPLEEVLFFFVISYCCLFIYECINTYFEDLKRKTNDDNLLKFIGLILLVTGIIFYKHSYTSWICILSAIFISVIYLKKEFFRHFSASKFILAYSIILMPFLVVNGLLTYIPVVIYNNEENLGLKIFHIPVEDVFYGMLLVMMNVAVYEKLKWSARRDRIKKSSRKSLNIKQ
jgi:lycopene cyclase domain-containing protein